MRFGDAPRDERADQQFLRCDETSIPWRFGRTAALRCRAHAFGISGRGAYRIRAPAATKMRGGLTAAAAATRLFYVSPSCSRIPRKTPGKATRENGAKE